LELLEDRTLLSVVIAGDPKVAQGVPYHLDLASDQNVSQWNINWGDSTQTIIGNPSSVSHTYNPSSTTTYAVSATALVNGNPVTANVSAGGQLVGTLVSSGSGGLTDQAPFPTFGPDGNVYISSPSGNSILRYDGTTGAFLGTFVAPGSGGLSLPYGLAFGPDGDLYVCSSETNSVLRYDGTTGTFLGTFVAPGSGGLQAPWDLAFRPDGNLYVESHGTGQLLRYDAVTGNFGGVFSTKATQGLILFCFGPDGDLYETDNVGVARYDGTTGAYKGYFVTPGSGGLSAPQDLTFGPDGDLYVASRDSSNVLRYDGATGDFLGVYASGGGLGATHHVNFRPDGDLYVTSYVSGVGSNIIRFRGPLTAAAGTQEPVTVLKTNTYSNNTVTKIPGSANSQKWVNSSLSVSGAGSVFDLAVTLNMTVPDDNQLTLVLVRPGGTSMTLVPRYSLGGSNLTNTVLQDSAKLDLGGSAAPHTGTFHISPIDSTFAGVSAAGTWTLQIRYTGSGTAKLNSWSLRIARDAVPLLAASAPETPIAQAVAPVDLQPLVQEAAARWQEAGLTPQQVAILRSVDVQIANLGGATLGLASGNTILIDDNAAGWGWFVDPTPRDDSEFTTPGDQGEQGKIDLLTVLTHEMGHLLGLEHNAATGDIMSATLGSGVRLMPTAGDLPGSTLAGLSPSHGDDVLKAHPSLRALAASSPALEATDALFAELTQRTQRI
jgi:streptogramin lyase